MSDEANKYASDIQARMSSALDYYVWKGLREEYGGGFPPKGSLKWREVLKLKAALYDEFYLLSRSDKYQEELEFIAKFADHRSS